MSEAKFTPGPWMMNCRSADDTGNYHEIGVAVLSETAGLSGVHRSGRYMLVNGCIDKHDASLIAAAPDLYEALYNVMLRFGPGTMEDKAFEDACNALRKARGEQL